MKGIEILAKEEINKRFVDTYLFICFASFEGRSTTTALSLYGNQIESSTIFKTVNTTNDYAINKIIEKLPQSKIVEFDLRNPVRIAQILTDCIKELSVYELPLVIDITTFTHEILAMLIKLIYNNKEFFPKVFLLYNGACDYSDSKESGLNQMWLSKGCRDVRNIIGYTGINRPILKNCLIVLTGFELERATGLIKKLEPDKLIIGLGVDPIHENNENAMHYFHEKFTEWKDNYKNYIRTEFEFSCKDISKTINSISDIISSSQEYNYIIVPLNTKLSTVAASIVALQKPSIQLCYSIPEVYNTLTYSKPSDKITVVDLYNII